MVRVEIKKPATAAPSAAHPYPRRGKPTRWGGEANRTVGCRQTVQCIAALATALWFKRSQKSSVVRSLRQCSCRPSGNEGCIELSKNNEKQTPTTNRGLQFQKFTGAWEGRVPEVAQLWPWQYGPTQCFAKHRPGGKSHQTQPSPTGAALLRLHRAGNLVCSHYSAHRRRLSQKRLSSSLRPSKRVVCPAD